MNYFKILFANRKVFKNRILYFKENIPWNIQVFINIYHYCNNNILSKNNKKVKNNFQEIF